MSYMQPLRARIEQLLTGETGTTRTIASGRFHRRAPDRGDASEPAHVAERAVEVEIGAAAEVPGAPVNPLDGVALYAHAVVVRVHYLVTHAGGDLAEGLGEQHGPGTIDAVRDRAATDAHDIAAVLGWYENHAGTDPAIVDLWPSAAPSFALRGETAVLELPYRLVVHATLPGSYA